MDSDTVVRDAFHSGSNADHQLVDGPRWPEAIPHWYLRSVVNDRGGQCMAHRDDLGRVAYRPVNNQLTCAAQINTIKKETQMRSDGKHLDKYRKDHPMIGPGPKGSRYGFFVVEHEGAQLAVISSGEHHSSDDGLGDWEHVSVSLRDRCPTWDEMCFVKDLFWYAAECVVQFHVPKSEHINMHPFCLHLWKSVNPMPLPPSIAVGLSKKVKRQGLARIIRKG